MDHDPALQKRGMILASGARGREFDSRSTPIFLLDPFIFHPRAFQNSLLFSSPSPSKFLGFLKFDSTNQVQKNFFLSKTLLPFPSHSYSAVDRISVTMSRSGQPPDLKKYMDKNLQIKLNANRMVVGTLRGFDQFMNLVVDNTVEVNGNEKTDIGMVVIRGNSVVTVEALEPVGRTQ
ncbi:hypothetical protein PTKIN_Ptkin13bG0246200 [Pterospermum kingtungense]